MNRPIKIIHKYKNRVRKIQYQIYIFVGDTVPQPVINILEKIKELNLYDSLINLTDNENTAITNFYGEFWYENFFNFYHIYHTKQTIKTNNARKREIIRKYGDAWVAKHIIATPLHKISSYSYDNVVRDEMSKKEYRRLHGKVVSQQSEIDEYKYQTRGSTVIDLLQHGGESKGIHEKKIMEVVEDDDEGVNPETKQAIISEEKSKIMASTVPDDSPDEIKYEEIEEMYQEQDIEPDKEAKKTRELISKTLGERKVKKILEPIEFDTSKSGINKDEVLIDVFTKKYIFNNYIYKDDTVKTAKNKICVSINMDPLFGTGLHLIPSRQYLWSEYYYQGRIEKIMIGQKWLRRNEILPIDVEPNNNLRVYEELRYNLKNLRDNIRRFGGKIKREDDENIILLDYDDFVTFNEFYMIDVYHELGVGYNPNREEQKNLSDIYLQLYFPKARNELSNIIGLLTSGQSTIAKIMATEVTTRKMYDDESSDNKESNNDTKEKKIEARSPSVISKDNARLELIKISSVYETVRNDLILEMEVMKYVEGVRQNEYKKYQKNFKENYVTQSFVHVDLMHPRLAPNGVSGQSSRQESKFHYHSSNINPERKIDLFRIFDNFITNADYPFVQYHTLDGQLVFKYDEEIINKKKDELRPILTKWFESSPYGISFKIRIMPPRSSPGSSESKTENKTDVKATGLNESSIRAKGANSTENIDETHMVINLNESGIIEYKKQWKEEDKASLADVNRTYVFVRKLLEKINSENDTIKFNMPQDDDFKHAFINTIQRFEIPAGYRINHNELSDFARYFFPYIALVIEPRKRESKLQKTVDKSKYGTYVRYKRISNYDNPARIEHRIYYFMKNYDYTDKSLAIEISKQFNITEKQASEEIEKVKSKFHKIKQARKVLKKIEDAPKYKPPGILIAIQGKQADKYKMHISGARDKNQLERIISFMNVLIYLYIDTYLLKKKNRQELKEKLKMLTNIAKRRHRVEEVVEYEHKHAPVKLMAQLDKERVGYTPEKGHNQYSRNCQNSGEDKKRQPQPLSLETLRKYGYKLNKSNNRYERTVQTKVNGRVKKVVLQAIPLKTKEGTVIYYACNPEENSEHTFIGFLSKSNNPHGLCMPCCFKKSPLGTKNKAKLNYFLRCVGELPEEEAPKKTPSGIPSKDYGDKIYILQDTNKIQSGRFGFLPKNLDLYLNTLLHHDRVIQSNYLVTSKKGYLFKFGTPQEKQPFLNAVGSCLGMTSEQIIDKIVKLLKRDKGQKIFTSLDNGDIRTRFKTIDEFVNYLSYSENIEFPMFRDLLSMPGVIHPNGVNIIVFQKNILTIKKSFEKEKIKEDFVILCQNIEDISNMTKPDRPTLIMIKELRNYYPIFTIVKPHDSSSGLQIIRIYNYSTEESNVIHHIYKFYKLNCSPTEITKLLLQDYRNAKQITRRLLETKDVNYRPEYQIIDRRNKCIAVVTKNRTIIPVTPSGSIYSLDIKYNYDDAIDTISNTLNKLSQLSRITKNRISITPIGVYYNNERDSETEFNVVGLKINGDLTIPVKPEVKMIDWINQHQLTLDSRQLYDIIDKYIFDGVASIIQDSRIRTVAEKNYEDEGYNSFRLEFSDFLKNYSDIKAKLKKIIDDRKLTAAEKKINAGKIIYRHIDTELYHLFLESNHIDDNKDVKASGNKIAIIDDDTTGMDTYQINNNRIICSHAQDREGCQGKCSFCKWKFNKCSFRLTREQAVVYVSKIIEELVGSNTLKMKELMQLDNYFISDIVDYTRYQDRPGQKIIKSTNNALKKTLVELFGQENIPEIGKKRIYHIGEVNYIIRNSENPIKDMGEFYLQNIIENNNTYFRAFANSLYWTKHKFYDPEYRNLGYFKELQTELSNYYKSLLIEWLTDRKNVEELKTALDPHLHIERKNAWREYIRKIIMEPMTLTNGLVEYYILNKITGIDIKLLNENGEPMYLLSGGKVVTENLTGVNGKKTSINIVYTFISNKSIPDKISVLYYK